MHTRNTIVTIAILATVAGILGTLSMDRTAFAQEEKDPGASGLAPDETPQDPSFDPDLAPDDAPGIEAEDPSEIPPGLCIGCADDLAPGKEGLKSGIIGPM